MTFKLEIDVPEGATKLDLAPILIPIIRGLMNRGNTGSRVTPCQVEAFLQRAYNTHVLDDRTLRLRRQWFVDYAESHGWRRVKSSDREIAFTKEKSVPDPKPDWWDRQSWYNQRHHLPIPGDHLPPTSRIGPLLRTLSSIKDDEKRPVADIVTDIEALAPVLDQLSLIRDQT